MSAIFQEVMEHITEIVRSEFRLARAEVTQDARYVASSSAFLIAGALLALFAFGLVLLSAVYGLAITLEPWASALVVAGAVGLLAATFFFIGLNKWKRVSLRPEKTIQSLQENVTWMKSQTK
jgi:hypothetical protein